MDRDAKECATKSDQMEMGRKLFLDSIVARDSTHAEVLLGVVNGELRHQERYQLSLSTTFRGRQVWRVYGVTVAGISQSTLYLGPTGGKPPQQQQ
jgi:hypothetical protein